MVNVKNEKVNSICVFASSCNKIDDIYFREAYKLGVEMAKCGYDVVYGGSTLGLMGEVTSAAKMHGSEVTGVMPERLYNLGISSGDCTKFILTKGMRERKAKMDELSQALIAIAGGFGTLEELSEMLVQKQLGYNDKPIVILNTNGFYDDLIKFFNKIVENHFAPKVSQKMYYIAKSPFDAINYINNYEFSNINYLADKIATKNKS